MTKKDSKKARIEEKNNKKARLEKKLRPKMLRVYQTVQALNLLRPFS